MHTPAKVLLKFRRGGARARVLLGLLWLIGLGIFPPTAAAISRLPAGDKARALAAYYGGDPEMAEAEYRLYLERYPRDEAAAKDLAAVLLDAGRGKEAAAVLQKAGVRGWPLAESLLAAGDFGSAEKEFSLLVAQGGNTWRARMLLGLIADLQGRTYQAVTLYWRAIQEEGKHPTVRLLLARAFDALGKDSPVEREYLWQRAREEYGLARKGDWSLWQVHWDLAQLAESKGQWSEARRQWQSVRGIVGPAREIVAALDRVQGHLTPVPTPVSAKVKPRRPPGLRAYRVQSLSPPGSPSLRVGLGQNLSRLVFGCSGPWRAKDGQGRNFWQGEGGRPYRLERNSRGRWTLQTWAGKSLKAMPVVIRIEPLQAGSVLGVINLYQDTGYMWGGGVRATHYYRGRLQARRHGRSLQLVNEVLLEDYLASVLPAEMPASWPREALKAQAVVARTDALRRRGTHQRQGYDVCATPHCAAYDGVTSEDARSEQALRETAGLVLVRDHRLVPAFYSHSCGGLTQDETDAWGALPAWNAPSAAVYDLPPQEAASHAWPPSPGELRAWLTTDPPAFCAPSACGACFRWVKILERRELEALLNTRHDLGSLQAIRVTARGRSGYVRTLVFRGDRHEATASKDNVRGRLGGLRSNFFVLVPLPDPAQGTPTAWLAFGGGWGHGVGFCQAGAATLGERGRYYLEILAHYFPGAAVQDRGQP